MGEGEKFSSPFFSFEKEKRSLSMQENGFYYRNGQKYMPIDFNYTTQVSVSVANIALRNLRISLDGDKPFLLNYLKRDILLTATGVPTTTVRFGFLLRNSRGDVQYSSGGIGSTDDYVVDTNYFGNASFPYVLQPSIWFDSNATIQFEVYDLGQGAAQPYTIFFTFGGQKMEKV